MARQSRYESIVRSQKDNRSTESIKKTKKPRTDEQSRA